MDSRNQFTTQLSPQLRNDHGPDLARLLSRSQSNISARLAKDSYHLPSYHNNISKDVRDSHIDRTPTAAPADDHDVRDSDKPAIYSQAAFCQIGEDLFELPAAKRHKIGDGRAEERQDSAYVAMDEANQTKRIIPGSPLPYLRRLPDTSHRAVLATRICPDASLAQRAAHGVEPPVMAVRVPAPRMVADFAPWTGTHPEDNMTEAVVKAGHFDKGSIQNESVSARLNIWPNLSLKNNIGLQTLSHLFVSAFEKRQAMGRCTAQSTFKPPPRVTVTDTKREAWLRDLANSKIPLRKQSRTIPHGIRGKLLMDQCLAKKIPLQRAVWLAKCVGANELRAFRRKGVAGPTAVSGELKWVREWTIAVEQFIESVVDTCGQKGWKDRMDYTIRLAMHIYVAKLVDRHHFLDWIVASLSGCESRALPVWIIMVQMYWKDVITGVSRGRRLAAALLSRLHGLKDFQDAANKMLQDRLRTLLKMLAVMNRACLVLPTLWPRYGYLLEADVDVHGARLDQAIVQDIARRNMRLCMSINNLTQRPQHPLLTLYQLLDETITRRTIDYPQLLKRCQSLVNDVSTLIRRLLDWTTTAFRRSSARIWIVANMLKTLREQGHDTDHTIIDYLACFPVDDRTNLQNALRVICHLTELHAFSVGRYFQRLITGSSAHTSDSSMAFDLLAVLSPDAIPAQTRNLRKTLLSRHKISDAFSDPYLHFVHELTAAIHDPRCPTPCLPDYTSLAEEMAISSQIHKCLREVGTDVHLHFAVFCFLRDALLKLQDMPGIAIIIAMCHDPDVTLLASMADTIDHCAADLTALGHLEQCTNSILDHYCALRVHHLLDRTLVTALLSLTAKSSLWESLRDQLENDLLICDQQSIITGCSPASDSLVNVQASILDHGDDIDAVFASGNTMDHHLMERVYNRVLTQLAAREIGGGPCCDKICAWLRQLRCFDIVAFEQLEQRTLQSFLHDAQRLDHLRAVVFLVASTSLTLQTVLETAIRLEASREAMSALSLLALTDSDLTFLKSDDKFRFFSAQHEIGSSRGAKIRSLLYRAMENPDFSFTSKHMQGLFLTHILSEVDAEVTNTGDFSGTAHEVMVSIMRAIIDPKSLYATPQNTLDPRPIMTLAAPLTIQICSQALRIAVRGEMGTHDRQKQIATLLTQEIDNDNPVWPELVNASGSVVQQLLYQWAHQICLAPSSPDSPFGTDRYLQVMTLTKSSSLGENDGTVFTTLADRLRDLEKRFADVDELTLVESTTTLTSSLATLLRIVALHLDAVDDSEATKQGRGSLLVALCSVLALPQLQTRGVLLESIFDLASIIYDMLPEAVTTAIQKSYEGSKTRNVLVEAALNISSAQNEDPRLLLQAQMPAALTQQQRVLGRHTLQQQQQIGSPAALRGPSGAASHAINQGLDRRASISAATPHKGANEPKVAPFIMRSWEMIQDPTPVMGENDSSLSLSLFGARKV